MHPRIQSFPRPEPDFREFLRAVRRQPTGRVPLVELAVDPEVVVALLEERSSEAAADAPPAVLAERQVRLLHRLGYDVVKVSAGIPFGVQGLAAGDTASLNRRVRKWQDQHRGLIQSTDDFDSFHWPSASEVDFSPVEAALRVLPDGMGILGFTGGVLEFATDLMGLEPFMYAVYDRPELVAAVVNGVGRTLMSVFETYCQMEGVCSLWLGDDLGSKTGLLLSPGLLGELIFPWYRRFVELAHRHGRPFLLHSCGNIAAVVPVLVADVGIDAKHSFEDAIEPVERFFDRWSDRIGVLGGIDVDLLSRGDPEAVCRRTRQVLEHAVSRGGYACGSGNSITNYVPPENYLSMVETVHRFNGRM